jgi:preprotein translocase subunit SecE
MSAKQNTAVSESGTMDMLKWGLVVLLVAAGVAGNSYYADQSLLYRVLGLVVVGGAALFIALQTVRGKSFSELVKEARIEVRKVVWPTHQETLQTTLMVLVVVLIAAVILWGLDTLLGWVASLIIG